MPDLNTALNDFLLAALALGTLLVTGYAIPYLKAHVGTKRLATAERVAEVAVAASEQMGAGSGAQKFQNALERARVLATSKGVTLTDEQWRTLIESAVRNISQWGAEIKATPAPVAEEL